MSTTVSSLLRTATCMVTPSASASRARTKTSWPPRNTPERRDMSECAKTRVWSANMRRPQTQTSEEEDVRVLVFRNLVGPLTWLHPQEADDVPHSLCNTTAHVRQMLKMNHKRGFMSWTYRLMSAQTPGQMSLLFQTHPPLPPMPPQSLVSEPSGCDRPPSPPDPLADTEEWKGLVLDQWGDTDIILAARWCVVGTYHVLIVVTVVIRLSCVGVTVSDQIFHGATERTRYWGEKRWVRRDEEQQCVCVCV